MPKRLVGNVDTSPGQTDVFQLTTICSQGQFNTTIVANDGKIARRQK
jgi:hypothetical protein